MCMIFPFVRKSIVFHILGCDFVQIDNVLDSDLQGPPWIEQVLVCNMVSSKGK